MTTEEVARGWVSETQPAGDYFPNNTPSTPRRAICEHRGDSDREIRVVGDFEESCINGRMAIQDKDDPVSMGVILSMATVHSQMNYEAYLRVRVADVAHAYNHFGIPSEQAYYSNSRPCSPEGAQRYAEMRTQPHESRRAPSNWDLISTISRFISGEMFHPG